MRAGGGRRLIALAGPPGAGKSTLAPLIGAAIGAGVVPMDGFHLDNRLLDAAGLRARKGAPDSFDVTGLGHALGRLLTGDEVILPAFDRDLDAAIAGAIRVRGETRLLLVEGNYLLARAPGWAGLARFWTSTILLEAPAADLRGRLAARWRGLPPDAAAARIAADLENAAFVAETAAPPSLRLDARVSPDALAARVAAWWRGGDAG